MTPWSLIPCGNQVEEAAHFGDSVDTGRGALTSWGHLAGVDLPAEEHWGQRHQVEAWWRGLSGRTQKSVPKHVGEGSPRPNVAGPCGDEMEYFLQLSRQGHGSSPSGYQPNTCLWWNTHTHTHPLVMVTVFNHYCVDNSKGCSWPWCWSFQLFIEVTGDLESLKNIL